MGLAHVACLARQGEVAVKEYEEWGTGEGFRKWEQCFDCGQYFHGAVRLALGWAGWKTYLGRPERDGVRCVQLQNLGIAVQFSKPMDRDTQIEALPILEASVALYRRIFFSDQNGLLHAQSTLACCLGELGRREEALRLDRMVYARSLQGQCGWDTRGAPP